MRKEMNEGDRKGPLQQSTRTLNQPGEYLEFQERILGWG